MKTLHIGHYDKFLPKFIQFTNKEFGKEDHFFLMMDKEKKYPHVDVENAKYISHKSIFYYIKYLYQAKQIILHGLFEKRLVFLLFLQPWLLKKVYWAIWGGDLYRYQVLDNKFRTKRYEFYRRFIISRFGHIITLVEGDYDNAKAWYGAKGKMHKCIMYQSQVYEEMNIINKKSETINILLGNSASLSNNHIEALEIIKKNVGDKKVSIYSPLSYGKADYRDRVIKKGKEIFGDSFHPMLDMMPLNEYLDFLGTIDIAVFNHYRQQAQGNTINLLGLGKKVYLNSYVSPFRLYRELGIKAFDVKDFKLEPEFSEKPENQRIVAEYFTYDRLKDQWEEIYKSN